MNNAFYIEGPSGLPGKVQFELIHLDPVAIGTIQTPINQSNCAIAIGESAGLYNQGECAIAIGESAGEFTQGMMAIAIGAGAGNDSQSNLALAMGVDAGSKNQATSAIAIGTEAGMTNQSQNAIAIGTHAGHYGQGENAIAIGTYAGQSGQSDQSIILNATGLALSGATKADALYIAPIQNATSSNVLYYNITSKEVSYGIVPSGGGGVTNGVNYSDYLFWNSYTTSWDAGQRELHLGSEAGLTGQASFAIALGYQAGLTGQSSNAIAIGNQAGKTNQPASSIELNATGVALTSVTKSNALYISPMSSITSSNALYYNPSTAEVSSYPLVSTPTPYYMDFLNTQMYTTAPVTAQVTNPLYTNIIPTSPTQPTITIPSIFNFSVGTGGDFSDLQTALASVSVTNGMNLRMIAGTYTIPDTTGITINKQVGIYAVDGTVILQTNASASAPVNAISIRAPNVTLYGITFRHLKTTNTSVESCINVQDTSVSPATGLNNIIIACCVIEFMEFGIIMLGDNFLITKNILSYTSGTNTTRRSIGLYRSTGNSFVTQNTIVDNGASGSLRFLSLTQSTGTVNEIYSGNLVVSGNIQSATSPLSQFINHDAWGSTGSSSFNLFVTGNDTNETSAFVVLVYSSANQGDMYDKVILSDNSCSNNHSGGGKGILALDNGGGASAFRSIGPLPVYASKNVVRNNVWRVDYVLATGSSGNIVGRRTTVPDASSNIRSFYGESIAVVSDFSLPLSGINVGGYTLGFYASIAEGVAQLEYKLGYTNSLGYGSAFNILQTGTFDVRSSTATLTNAFLNIPYNLFTVATNRLRLEINVKNVSGNAPVIIYSRDATNGSFSMVYKFSGYAL